MAPPPPFSNVRKHCFVVLKKQWFGSAKSKNLGHIDEHTHLAP